MDFSLRPYQRQAVEAVYRYLRQRDGNPAIVLPTGVGKTYVIATICRDAVQRWQGRVLILAHVKELLEQAAEKLRLVAPHLPFGVYSAGLKRRDLGYPVTVAGIQSVYQKACDIGPVDLVIVDEAHLIPPEGEGMYRTFLADVRKINPHVRVIGLTATPFRMRTGTICSPENILNEVCYEISVRELIVQGYLCPLCTKAGSRKPDTARLHVRAGEYVASEVEELMDEDGLDEERAERCAELVCCLTAPPAGVSRSLSVAAGWPRIGLTATLSGRLRGCRVFGWVSIRRGGPLPPPSVVVPEVFCSG